MSSLIHLWKIIVGQLPILLGKRQSLGKAFGVDDGPHALQVHTLVVSRARELSEGGGMSICVYTALSLQIIFLVPFPFISRDNQLTVHCWIHCL